MFFHGERIQLHNANQRQGIRQYRKIRILLQDREFWVPYTEPGSMACLLSVFPVFRSQQHRSFSVSDDDPGIAVPGIFF